MLTNPVYIHNKTGNRYVVLGKGKHQYKNVWKDTIVYIREEWTPETAGMMYSRYIKDFEASFTIAEEQ